MSSSTFNKIEIDRFSTIYAIEILWKICRLLKAQMYQNSLKKTAKKAETEFTRIKIL